MTFLERWQAVLTMVAGGLVYLAVGAYQMGVYSQRMIAVEKSVDNLTVELHEMQKHVIWKGSE